MDEMHYEDDETYPQVSPNPESMESIVSFKRMVAIHDEVENEGHSQKEKQKEDNLFSPLSRFNQKRKLQKVETSKFTWNVDNRMGKPSRSFQCIAPTILYQV